MPLWTLSARLPVAPAVRFFEIGRDVGTTLDNYRRALKDSIALVAISHVTTDTGTLLPIAEMVRLAHEAGAEILVDGAQAPGQLPVDLRALDADYYAGIGSKWLMGPVGTGFLYLRESLQPSVEVSWTGFTAEAWYRYPFGEFELHGTARKFEFGARHWPLYFGFGAALDYLSDLGLDKIWRCGRWGADRLRAALSRIPGVRLLGPSDPAMQSGMLAFAIDDRSPDDVSNALRARFQIVQRPAPHVGGVRLCVAAFNTEEELDAVVDAVRLLALE